MGPRPFSRGDPTCCAPACSDTGFNGTAANQPRTRGQRAERRGRSSCFDGTAAIQPRTRIQLPHGVHVRRASMGPRPISRGDLPGTIGHGAASEPSMGPRPLSRGDGSTGGGLRPTPWRFNGTAANQPRRHKTDAAYPTVKFLQWDRGQSAAETLSPLPTTHQSSMLQWDRGH